MFFERLDILFLSEIKFSLASYIYMYITSYQFSGIFYNTVSSIKNTRFVIVVIAVPYSWVHASSLYCMTNQISHFYENPIHVICLK